MFINIINNNIDLHNLIKLLILKTNVMEQFKRAKIIMLETNKQTSMFIINNTLYNYHKPQQGGKDINVENVNLYVISDDKIKAKDKVIFNDNIYTVLKTGIYYNGDFDLQVSNSMFIPSNRSKKIIATTDTSLTIKIEEPKGVKWDNTLPQPSQQFIEKYVESYNKSEIITDVLVEYLNELKNFQNTFNCNTNPHHLKNNKLKINPKDNTITIKKVKDSWNKEEVVNLIKKLELDIEQSMDSDDDDNIFTNIDINKWIEENL